MRQLIAKLRPQYDRIIFDFSAGHGVLRRACPFPAGRMASFLSCGAGTTAGTHQEVGPGPQIRERQDPRIVLNNIDLTSKNSYYYYHPYYNYHYYYGRRTRIK